MRGFGFQCDECAQQAVIEGDPFMDRGRESAPAGWLVLYHADPTPGVALERTDLCSWGCVASRARAEFES